MTSHRNRPHPARLLLALLVAAVSATALTAAPSADAKAHGTPARPIRWLGAGDSFSSGHGTPGEQGDCRRNDLAWPPVAKANLSYAVSEFRFAACSGNVTGDIWTQSGWQPQTHEAYDLITFSFGGNDIDFAGAIKQCATGGLAAETTPLLWGHWESCPPDSQVRARIDALAATYRDMLSEVAQYMTTTGGNIVVVGYPALLEDPNRWTGIAQAIDLCNGISNNDAYRIRGWAGHLNATIGQAVQDTTRRFNNVTITFVNIQDGSSNQHLYEPDGSNGRHNLCGTDSWLNGLHLSNGFHPDLGGHQHTGQLVAQVLNGLDWSHLGEQGQVATPTNPVAPTGPAVTSAPVTTGGSTGGPAGSLSFSVVGSCTSAGGVLGSSSSNFTPGGRYTIAAYNPDGSRYTNLSLGAAGTVGSNGSVAWQWDCTGDPPGTYTTELVDSSTGRSTGQVPFTVGSDTTQPPPTAAPPPTTPPTTVPAPRTYPAQQGSRGANTFSNPTNAAGQGPRIEPMTWVEVSCKLKPASTIASAYPDGYWYRIASAPWNDQYYAVANTFWNGDVPGQTPYTHNTDYAIPDC